MHRPHPPDLTTYPINFIITYQEYTLIRIASTNLTVHNILWLSRLHESLPGTHRQIHTILACEYKEQEKKLQNELKALGVDTHTLWTRFQEIRAASTVCTLKSMLDDCLPIYIANILLITLLYPKTSTHL